MERGRIEGLSKFFEYPLLSQERIKLRNSNFVCTFLVSIGTKAHYNFGKSSRGRLRGLSKLFRAPIYWAHRAVVFAIARLSCIPSHQNALQSTLNCISTLRNVPKLYVACIKSTF